MFYEVFFNTFWIHFAFFLYVSEPAGLLLAVTLNNDASQNTNHSCNQLLFSLSVHMSIVLSVSLWNVRKREPRVCWACFCVQNPKKFSLRWYKTAEKQTITFEKLKWMFSFFYLLEKMTWNDLLIIRNAGDCNFLSVNKLPVSTLILTDGFNCTVYWPAGVPVKWIVSWYLQ